MDSTCRPSYIPVPEGDSDDNIVLINSVPLESTTPEKGRILLREIDTERLQNDSIGGWEGLRCHRFRLKMSVLLLLAGFGSWSLFAWSFPSCSRKSGVAEVRLSVRGQPVAEDIFLSQVKAPSSPVLEVFQVYQPVLIPPGVNDHTIEGDGSPNTTTVGSPEDSSSCIQVLMEYSFGFSYGHPFVGNYTPPSCQFNRIIMNFTVTSKGRQFDRLALMYFGDTEVWRTSTAEPTADGIRWTYMKDMSEYLYFWKQPQKLIFDLGNLVDSTYTGLFNTTLTATFFTGPSSIDPAPLIIPISARNSAANAASLFVLPADTAANIIRFPRNANRAVFSVSACGQADEEFWWSNVLQSDTNTFVPNVGTLPGFSPWREVQIYIDGRLAGVEWPFPVIFTGGIAPGLWRPIVGIDAFDLREHEIDITPWLPVLCDGQEHKFEIKVAGIIDSGGSTGTLAETVGNSWYVTGKIFVWLDSPSSITTGTQPAITLPQPYISLTQSYTQNATGANQTLSYSTTVTRSLSISSIVKTQQGTFAETWTQSLKYSNLGFFTDQGNTQTNDFRISGHDVSTGLYPYRNSYGYPLYANTTVAVDPSGNFSISANFAHGLLLETYGNSIYPSGLESFYKHRDTDNNFSSSLGSYLRTVQNGTAYYFSSPSTGTGMSFGSTEQDFMFGAIFSVVAEELYTRDVAAANGTVVKDKEALGSTVLGDYTGPDPPAKGMGPQSAATSPRQVIGRGPGQVKSTLAQEIHPLDIYRTDGYTLSQVAAKTICEMRRGVQSITSSTDSFAWLSAGK